MTAYYAPVNNNVRLPRMDTPPRLHGLLQQIAFDDPITCLSFLAEQQLREYARDLSGLAAWIMSAWTGIRAAERVPDLPDDIPLESACLYVVDFWVTVHISYKIANDRTILLDARPPTVGSYRATLRDFERPEDR